MLQPSPCSGSVECQTCMQPALWCANHFQALANSGYLQLCYPQGYAKVHRAKDGAHTFCDEPVGELAFSDIRRTRSAALCTGKQRPVASAGQGTTGFALCMRECKKAQACRHDAPRGLLVQNSIMWYGAFALLLSATLVSTCSLGDDKPSRKYALPYSVRVLCTCMAAGGQISGPAVLAWHAMIAQQQRMQRQQHAAHVHGLTAPPGDCSGLLNCCWPRPRLVGVPAPAAVELPPLTTSNAVALPRARRRPLGTLCSSKGAA